MVHRDVNARLRSVLRLTAAGATAAFLAGCSSDVSRLATGPFGPADNTPTASIGSRTLTPPEAINGAPAIAANSAGTWGASSRPTVGAIQSAPLAPLAAPVATAAISRPSTQSVTTAATSAARTAGGSFGPWTTAGGSAVTVGQGESASVLAARYGVPTEALVKANGLSSASQVTPGKSLVIPVYNAAGRQASSALPSSTAVMATAGVGAAAVGAGALAKNAMSAPRSVANSAATTATSAAKTATGATRTVASAATTATTAAKVVANPANSATTAARTQVSRVVDPARKPEPKVAEAVDASRQKVADAAKAATAKKEVAKVEQTKAREAKAREVAAQKVAETERQQTAAAPAAAAASAADKPEFRWPARGRIIQGFKSGANDGIAIAVPEGTAVKAAEGGVVAYAGSELKGYGNLVLIRHTNGFVSAYAHNGELNVKRGESVKRGQTIAKSGQSGNVSTPQLHFELRKGSTPVDPTQYLAGL